MRLSIRAVPAGRHPVDAASEPAQAPLSRIPRLEHALESMLGDRLRERLAFKPGIDWTSGLAASLGGQIDYLMRETEWPITQWLWSP
jgi:hypothetical protein